MKPTFTFIKHNDEANQFDSTRLTMDSDAITLTELLENFAAFLAGCGFAVKIGEVIYEPEQEEQETEKYPNIDDEQTVFSFTTSDDDAEVGTDDDK